MAELLWFSGPKQICSYFSPVIPNKETPDPSKSEKAAVVIRVGVLIGGW